MLIAAVVVGALTAYYFGLRAGAWAAAVTVVACVAALFVPRWSIVIYLGMAGAAVAVWQVGSRRPRRPDAVLAVHWVRRQWKRVAGGGKNNPR